VVSHGKLRQLLAAYLGQAPKAIVFELGACGKPFIIPSIGSLHFNLAHAGDFMIAAVSPAVEVGIDIEVLQNGRNVNELVEFVMADSERAYWQALPASAKEDFFYQLWTRKESFIKAVGLGLSLAPNLIETAVTGPCRFLSLPKGLWSRTDSTLVDLIVPAGVKGALTALTPVKIVPVMQEET
jgi:4'-phosphopantetheinyl transferase